MNKTDRLFAIVLELQRGEVMRAEDLAKTFETSVRTIYRDIQALSEAGVPVSGSPGVGYSLIEGYFLPPVSFTLEEAVALIIGADFIEQRFDHHYGKNARASRGKIEALLPKTLKEETARVRSGIRLIHPEEPRIVEREKSNIETIRLAILEGKKIRFEYHKNLADGKGNRATFRTVAPYGLVLVNGMWMLVANCDLRQDVRHFRIMRIINPVITNYGYQIPTDFNLHEYQPIGIGHDVVCLRFNADIADKVENSNNYYIENSRLHADGYDVNYRVNRPEEILNWVLGWGSQVIVLEPESLKIRVKEEIERMRKRY
ncbi:YafY family protein [Paenibacillus sp. FSL R10-2782]|uniref:helix-turn-helix transcriptional regulator n=1 Tax=Paenibacillus sp. FSL R10-2782 TaxID=2954661 RepID=UPI003158F5AD